MKAIPFIPALATACHAGTKTQTRRVFKQQPQPGCEPECCGEIYARDSEGFLTEKVVGWGAGGYEGEECYACPYGKPGDVLWVRETHYRFGHWQRRKKGWAFVADGDAVLFEPPAKFKKSRDVHRPEVPAWHKRNALFMPQACARTVLEIVTIRAERLGEISAEDALAEGVESYFGKPQPNPCHAFAQMWEEINGTYDATLWVWVIEFRGVGNGC